MKYQILRALSVVYPDHAETDIIASMLRMDEKLVLPYLVKMTDSHKLYGPLIRVCADGWTIAGYNQDAEDKLTAEQIEKVLKENAMWRTESSGGWGYLSEVTTNPTIIQTNTNRWKEEIQTGIKANGKQSTLVDAVLQKAGSSVPDCRDPQDKAYRTNKRLLRGKYYED